MCEGDIEVDMKIRSSSMKVGALGLLWEWEEGDEWQDIDEGRCSLVRNSSVM